MFKKLLVVACAVLFLTVGAGNVMADPVEFSGPGWYVKTHGQPGAHHYFGGDGHPVNSSEWTLLEIQPPPPSEGFDVAGHYVASPLAVKNTSNGGTWNALNYWEIQGGVAVGGTSFVDIEATGWQYGIAEGEGGPIADIGGFGGFLMSPNSRLVFAISHQTADSVVTGFATGGVGEEEYTFTKCRRGRGCREITFTKDINPDINIDLTVYGVVESSNLAVAGAGQFDNDQWARAMGSSFQGATYWGNDSEGNDWFIFWELPLGYNILRGEGEAIGFSVAGVHRNGTGNDMNNSVTAWSLTGGTATADVFEPVEIFPCFSTQPDNGEIISSYGSGIVQGAVFTSNPQGSSGFGSYEATYSFNAIGGDGTQGYGLAGGKTTAIVGNGYSKVTSSGFSVSSGFSGNTHGSQPQ